MTKMYIYIIVSMNKVDRNLDKKNENMNKVTDWNE